jgi:NAD(P)-dependent dehydrogenase (short-subunit alcohol dehydrogenase family)
MSQSVNNAILLIISTKSQSSRLWPLLKSNQRSTKSCTMSQSKLLIVVGSGPGIGVAAACRFALEGYNVALISRSLERLNDDVANVYAHRDEHKDNGKVKSNVKIQPFAADTSDHVALKKALDDIHEAMGPPEVVLYNAARINTMVIEEASVEDMMEDFKVCTMYPLPSLPRMSHTTP